MRAGTLDRRITIQQPAETGRTALNEPLTAWQDVAAVWAGVAPQSEGERVEADKPTATRTVKFRIRWRPGIDERCRILFDDLAWGIVGIREIGRRVALEITAEAKI